jgi:hypothetical protein
MSGGAWKRDGAGKKGGFSYTHFLYGSSKFVLAYEINNGDMSENICH